MRIAIVDDEKLASSRVQRLLQELGYEDMTVFNDSEVALEDMKKNIYDVVFLDIQMPKINGLDLANEILVLSSNTFIIFQTAFEEFAIEAFQVGGLDYILKPTTLENIEKSMNKVKKYMASKPQIPQNKKLMGRWGSKIYLLDIDDIYYIKADLDEIIVRVNEASVYVKKKIGQMEELLAGRNFFRIHRSSIVNVEKIKAMQSVEQSKFEISFDGIDDVVTSSKEGAKEFREYLERTTI